jgi:hypothetical protein
MTGLKCKCGRARPVFGLNGETPSHCASCKTNGMVDVVNRKCFCKRAQPRFGVEGQRPTRCAACKIDGMVNLVSKRCLCKRAQPSFGAEGERPTHCAACKTDGMVNLVSKRCLCKRAQPTFGVEGERPTHCAACKTDGMVDLVHKRCLCKRALPSFGAEGERPTRCAACKTDGMVDVVHRKCMCKRSQPRFGLVGERPTRCAACKTDGMIDVVNTMCKNGCGTRAHSTHYKGYCLRCFVYLFPGEKVSRNFKVKEQHFTDNIKAAGILSDHSQVAFDKKLQGGCSGRKPDIFVDLYTHTVHCENDEDQHRNYTCENKRLMELFRDAGNRPQVQLRFNPDGFTAENGVRHPSCFKYNK